MFMNEWEIAEAEQRYASYPVLGPASRTLRSLADWTNENSDGWPFWPKPARAAGRLMELIEGYGTSRWLGDERADATVAEYRASLRPVKSFRTRQSASFEVYEV